MNKQFQLSNPEIWGGLECTINRIGNTFRDQLSYAGHYKRENDIDKFAALGITSLRYPVLWEAHQRNLQNENINWDITKQRLENIRSYGITPIVGLIHHGSGPAVQGLQDDFFPNKLATYAGKVARAFPWLEYYTPVNEPLTTARFSGLYGVWYPHLNNELSFIKMFLNQLKGIVLAMRAVRKVNSNALLVQTEDLAKIHSSPSIQYQADFENERRWITYDFLYGKVNKDHFFWNYFLSLGIEQHKLEFFLNNPCKPAIAGFNYYVTSERFLDTNVHAYPQITDVGNGKDRYVDIAAVRALKMSGLKVLLREAWDRYHAPMAITEVHINCTREEQLRWFMEAWQACCETIKEGIDVKAITAWALLGSFDWTSLLTRDEKEYESGVFDITNGEPRPTAMAKLITSLSATGIYHHPVLEEEGWWHHSYPGNVNKNLHHKTTPLLIIGSDGTLGTAFTKICNRRSIAYHALSRHQLDITSSASIEQAVETYKPWAIINASGYLNIDEAENDSETCFNINTHGVAILATICNQHAIQLVTFSSDLVFDGEKQQPYVESDVVKPLNVYGESKALGEKLAVQHNPSVLIIRTSSFFGPWDRFNFAFNVLQSMAHGKIFNIANDVIVSPTYVPHLVDKALDLLIDEEKGIWHLSNNGHYSMYSLAEEVAMRGGYTKKSIVSCSQTAMYWRAKRPAFSALGSAKGIRLPSFHSALENYFNEKIF